LTCIVYVYVIGNLPYTMIYPITLEIFLFLDKMCRYISVLNGLTIDHVFFTVSHCQAKALLTDDYGKDLASVEALIRRHDELERDLTAIENKLEVSAFKCTCVCVCVFVCVCVCARGEG